MHVRCIVAGEIGLVVRLASGIRGVAFVVIVTRHIDVHVILVLLALHGGDLVALRTHNAVLHGVLRAREGSAANEVVLRPRCGVSDSLAEDPEYRVVVERNRRGRLRIEACTRIEDSEIFDERGKRGVVRDCKLDLPLAGGPAEGADPTRLGCSRSEVGAILDPASSYARCSKRR